jgi:hypothetical protein
MEKLLVMSVASQLTMAATGTVPAPLSADLSDNAARAKNLQVWETFRAFYHALVKALTDASWVTPDLTPATGGIFAGVLQQLLGKIPALPKVPLPNPGDTPAPHPPAGAPAPGG